MPRQTPFLTSSATLAPGQEGAASGSVSRRVPYTAGLLALAALAWGATDLRMAGMDAGPGTDPGALGFYLSAWVVMMVAMMLPAITPMVLAYRDLRLERAHRPGATAPFLAGYLLVWTAAGLLAYALLEAGRGLPGAPFAWDRAGRWVAVGVLCAAAVYQLTPLKSACLSRCRSRQKLLVEGWREGRIAGARLGVRHGAWCLGCCWALMAALFALGAMSLVWMAVVSALVAAERLFPWRAAATAAVAALLATVAIGVAAAPARVPGLTIPGSPGAMRAMGASPSGSIHAPMSTMTQGRHGSP